MRLIVAVGWMLLAVFTISLSVKLGVKGAFAGGFAAGVFIWQAMIVIGGNSL